MTLKEKIQTDAINAMKAKEVLRLEVLRAAKTLLINKEKELRQEVDDATLTKLLNTMIKQRRDSIEQFTKGNRPELAAKEAEEIRILESYLPKELSEAEINHLLYGIFTHILTTDNQRVIGNVMKELKLAADKRDTRLDGKLASKLAKQALENPTELVKYESL